MTADGGWFSTTGRDPVGAAAVEGGLRRRRAGGHVGERAEPARCCRIWSRTTASVEKIDRTLRLFGDRITQSGTCRPDDAGRALVVSCRYLAAGHRWRPGRRADAGDDAGCRPSLSAVHGDGADRARVSRGASTCVTVDIRLRRDASADRSAKGTREGMATAYVCRAFSCESPTTSLEELRARLDACAPLQPASEASAWAGALAPAVLNMNIQLDIWLRGTNHATTHVISPVGREPRAWTDGDVQAVLVGMLRALDRANDPQGADERPVALRGFSWIVNPFDEGGVVIALELSLGAVVAGPFDIAERELSSMIARVIAADSPHGSGERRQCTDQEQEAGLGVRASPPLSWSRKRSGRRGEAVGRSRARRLSELLRRPQGA